MLDLGFQSHRPRPQRHLLPSPFLLLTVSSVQVLNPLDESPVGKACFLLARRSDRRVRSGQTVTIRVSWPFRYEEEAGGVEEVLGRIDPCHVQHFFIGLPGRPVWGVPEESCSQPRRVRRGRMQRIHGQRQGRHQQCPKLCCLWMPPELPPQRSGDGRGCV